MHTPKPKTLAIQWFLILNTSERPLQIYIKFNTAKQTRPKGLVCCLVGEDIGFERQLLATWLARRRANTSSAFKSNR